MTKNHLSRDDSSATDLADLRNTCATYSAHLKRPIVVDVATRRIVAIAGNDLDAITMPAQLGRRLWAELASNLQVGPTIVGPGPHWWTMLTQKSLRVRMTCPPQLHRAHVNLIPRGAQIVLPSPRDTENLYSWIEPPRPSLWLPTWAHVMAAAAHLVGDEFGSRPRAS